MKSYIFVLLVFLIPFISAENFGYNYLDKGVNLNSNINYSTVNVNNSDTCNCWTTLEGVKCDVSDITYDEISGGDVNAIGYTGYFSYLVGPVGGIDMRADPWYWSGVSHEFSGDVYVDNNFEVYNNSTFFGNVTIHGISFLNNTIVTDLDIDTYDINTDASLLINSGMNMNSCINLTEGGMSGPAFGFRICNDGSGTNNFVISNFETGYVYLTIDRDSGMTTFYNDTTFTTINLNSLNVTGNLTVSNITADKYCNSTGTCQELNSWGGNSGAYNSSYYLVTNPNHYINYSNLSSYGSNTINGSGGISTTFGVSVGTTPDSTIGYRVSKSVGTYGGGTGLELVLNPTGTEAQGIAFTNILTCSGTTSVCIGADNNIISSGAANDQDLTGMNFYMGPNGAGVATKGAYIFSTASTYNNPTVDQNGIQVNWIIGGTDTGMKRWAFKNVGTTAGSKIKLGMDNIPSYLGTNNNNNLWGNTTGLYINSSGNTTIVRNLKVNNTYISNDITTRNINLSGNLSVRSPYYYGYDNSTQNFLVAGTVQVINISNNNDVDKYQINVTRNQNLTFSQSGDYICVLSPEFFQNGGGSLISFWYQKNGVDVPWSNSRFNMTNNEYNAPAITYQFDIENPATDNIRFMWYSDSTSTQIYSSGTLTLPTRPSVPGILLNCHKISEIT